MITNELTCKEFVEIVTEFLEGSMPVEERARFEAHLGACGGCRTYLEQILETIRMVGILSENHIPLDARDTQLNAFRSWKNNPVE
jgi:predicted anti-sigma-YlaC factor YlaD